MQAQFLIPMAVSLSYGIIMATLITLILLPSLIIAISNFRILIYSLNKRIQFLFFSKIISFILALILIPPLMMGILKLNMFTANLTFQKEDFEPAFRELKRLKKMA